jgi:signal transduction histidine kinase
LTSGNEPTPGSAEELFDEAPCGYVSTLPDGTVLKSNRTLLDWLGRQRSDVEGKLRLQDLLTVPGRIYYDTHLAPMLRMQKQFREVALEFVRDGSAPLSAIVHAVQKNDARDQPLVVQYAIFEAAHRRQYERELLLARNAAEQATRVEREARATAERMSRAKDDVLALVSHELRTPLSAILGWVQVLRMKFSANAEVAHGLEVIERNTRIQARLVEDLLDMSRVISGKLRLEVQEVGLASVVASAIETAEASMRAKGIRLQQVLDPGVIVSGDPARLQQVFWNLLSNAVKFTPRDGSIRVVMQRVNSHVEIAVVDSGLGMNPELIAHVFERFRQADSSATRETGGLGLGLSLVKYLVEMHGGSIAAQSEGEGRGSTFIVSLPALAMQSSVRGSIDADTEVFKTDASLGDLSLRGLQILVVDDSSDAREAIRQLLFQRGARVTTAGSAAEALTLAAQVRPDVLISDIGLPTEDGYELLRKLRMLGEDVGRVPAIALTAMSRLEDRTQALLAGYQSHLAKPVDATELLVTIASLAGRLPVK